MTQDDMRIFGVSPFVKRIKMGSDGSHSNVSLIVRDSVYNPQLLTRRESRRGIEPRFVCYLTLMMMSVLLYVHRNRRLIRDVEPRTATSTFSQLLSSEEKMRCSCSVLLYVHRDRTDY